MLQAADPRGLETPRNIYVYSRYRDRSKRRRRHVRSQRARFRHITRAQVLKRCMIKLLDTCLPLAFSLIGYKIRRLLKCTLLIHCDACAENIYWKCRYRFNDVIYVISKALHDFSPSASSQTPHRRRVFALLLARECVSFIFPESCTLLLWIYPRRDYAFFLETLSITTFRHYRRDCTRCARLCLSQHDKIELNGSFSSILICGCAV